jgi:MOSC domain-containing protein YiiM
MRIWSRQSQGIAFRIEGHKVAEAEGRAILRNGKLMAEVIQSKVERGAAGQVRGTLIGIARVTKLGGPPEEVSSTGVSVRAGIAGDARGTKRNRQVTVLFREGWQEACRGLGTDLPWTLRRANLYVQGVECPRTAGARLRIGQIVLEVTQETDPCDLMERAHPGLRGALTPEWRGGVCCAVVMGGPITVGDSVEVISYPE